MNRSKKPVWYESLSRRHAYQAWVAENCAVAIIPDNYRWRWRVGNGDLTSNPGPFDPANQIVAKEGVVKTRQGAKTAALKAAKKACPVSFGGRRRRR